METYEEMDYDSAEIYAAIDENLPPTPSANGLPALPTSNSPNATELNTEKLAVELSGLDTLSQETELDDFKGFNVADLNVADLNIDSATQAAVPTVKSKKSVSELPLSTTERYEKKFYLSRDYEKENPSALIIANGDFQPTKVDMIVQQPSLSGNIVTEDQIQEYLTPSTGSVLKGKPGALKLRHEIKKAGQQCVQFAAEYIAQHGSSVDDIDLIHTLVDDALVYRQAIHFKTLKLKKVPSGHVETLHDGALILFAQTLVIIFQHRTVDSTMGLGITSAACCCFSQMVSSVDVTGIVSENSRIFTLPRGHLQSLDISFSASIEASSTIKPLDAGCCGCAKVLQWFASSPKAHVNEAPTRTLTLGLKQVVAPGATAATDLILELSAASFMPGTTVMQAARLLHAELAENRAFDFHKLREQPSS